MEAHIEIPRCKKCDSRNVRLRRHIISNGGSQVGWYCLDGDHWALYPGDGQWIAHKMVKKWLAGYGKTIGDIAVVKDSSEIITCAVEDCSKPAEVHHIAPRALFGTECEKWPTVYLCIEHHAKWHKIVLAQRELEAA